MTPFEAHDVRLILGGWKARAVAWTAAAAGALSVALSAGSIGPSFYGGIVLALAGTLVGLHLQTRPRSRVVQRLVADASGVWADGRCLVPRADLLGATLERRALLQPLVHLRTAGKRRMTLAMPDALQAEYLVGALALGSARPVESFRVRAGIFSNKTAQSVLAALMLSFRFSYIWLRHLGVVGWTLMLVVLVVALLNTFWPTRIEVGADGVLVSSLLRRWFYPFAQISHARKTDWGVTLTRKSWREVEIRTEAKQNAKPSADRDALFERIQQRLAELRALEGPGNAGVLVARGGRSVEEWIHALQALGGGDGGGYRAPAVPDGELWRILEDPGSDASARAGAAVALRAGLDDEGRSRLRIAAGGSASPKVRIALQAVASDAAETELARALAECEDEGPTSVRVARAAG